ncbi:MAG: TM2 domain-containing protein [Methylococcales bacterium]|nr:TM2 domain-containing protein [Methylococcales bacterium]
MLGHIESLDLETRTGVIKHEDSFYEFHMDQWTSVAEPEVNDDVEFTLEDGQVIQVELVGTYLTPEPVKSQLTAVLLALFTGMVGGHRFYLGYWQIGLAMVAFTLITQGFGVVWGVVECFLLFSGHIHADAKGRPLKPFRKQEQNT